jgi:hypothetical protein
MREIEMRRTGEWVNWGIGELEKELIKVVP